MKRFFLSLFSALMLGSALIVGGYWHDAYVVKPATDAASIALVVQSGESLKVIAQKLKDSGIINNAWTFALFAKLNDQAKKLQAGTFSLKHGMSFEEVVQTLSHATGDDVEVTVPEGKTAAQTGELVQAAFPQITMEEWKDATGSKTTVLADATLADALPLELKSKGLEGFLFPDTYRLFPSSNAERIVKTMLEEFVEKTSTAGIHAGADGRVAHGLNFYEFVTLASIVEREVQSPEDMRQVAGIFLKRLEAHMPLQADSTVNYVTGGKNPGISLVDTGIDSPYNTYKVQGLPPGPISNPGLNALTAVLVPAKNDWYYFLTTPQGDVKYARTYDEHLANKQKYRK